MLRGIEHLGQHRSKEFLGQGQQGASARWRRVGVGGKVDKKAAQEVAPVIPARPALIAGARPACRPDGGAADDIGVVGIERMEPVQSRRGGAGNAVGIDDKDTCPEARRSRAVTGSF